MPRHYIDWPIADCWRYDPGEEIDMRGPMGEIIYKGKGHFQIEGKDYQFDKVSSTRKDYTGLLTANDRLISSLAEAV